MLEEFLPLQEAETVYTEGGNFKSNVLAKSVAGSHSEYKVTGAIGRRE
jgi:hypothetical protein